MLNKRICGGGSERLYTGRFIYYFYFYLSSLHYGDIPYIPFSKKFFGIGMRPFAFFTVHDSSVLYGFIPGRVSIYKTLSGGNLGRGAFSDVVVGALYFIEIFYG
ncbi:MAG: hypothetical protein LBE14_00755 [Treponema sp.]|nr:hypothetical protein [Treponema sp.]